MLAIISALAGCAEKYTIQDITGISLFESGMDRNSSYSFGLAKEGDSWYLSAECGNVGKRGHFDCICLRVDAEPILDIIESGGYIKKTRKNKLSGVFAPDAPSRGLMLTFSDGTRQSASITAPELRDAFIEISEKLDEAVPLYSPTDVTGLYISYGGMDNAGYSFELFRDDGWCLSADFSSDDSRITFDNIRISDSDADALIDIAFDEELDMKVFTWRELPDGLKISDADSFHVSMRFGKEIETAAIRSERLEESFSDLARKYAGNEIPEEE